MSKQENNERDPKEVRYGRCVIAANIMFSLSVLVYMFLTTILGFGLIQARATDNGVQLAVYVLALIFSCIGFGLCLAANVVSAIIVNVNRPQDKLQGVRHIVMAAVIPVTVGVLFMIAAL